jgi:CRISPR-associated protein Cmr1
VITPLFGGGVEPAQADPISVVRASEVRGQLRFWWRATRGGQFGGNLQAMRDAEEALWGGPAREKDGKTVAGQSLVQVEVEVIERGWPMIPEHISNPTLYEKEQQKRLTEALYTPELARKLGGKSYYYQQKSQRYETLTVGDPASKDGYLAFPLRKDEQRPAGAVYEGVQLKLEVRYPKAGSAQAKAIQTLFPALARTEQEPEQNITHEIAAALWAWETFGGLGARTRRGFGALALQSWRKDGVEQTIERPANVQDAQGWLERRLNTYVVAYAAPAEVPHLSPTTQFRISGQGNSGKVVWRDLGQKLKKFRQRRSDAYGRSKWPEPDAVRRLAQTYYQDNDPKKPAHNHGRPVHDPLHIEAFPRAAFGLPISFEFHREQTNPQRALTVDPQGKNTLQGDAKEHERFASPLILRPLQCAHDSFVGLAVILEGTHLPPMQITVRRGTVSHKESDRIANLTQSEAQAIGKKADIPSLASATTTVTPQAILLAFLEWL